MNVPAAHAVHVCCPVWALYVPAEQLVATSLPTGQNVPWAHATQSSALAIAWSSGLVRVPPGQGSGEGEPLLQNEAEGQALHVDRPVASW